MASSSQSEQSHLGPDNPARAKFMAARNSLRNNPFLNNPTLSDHDRIYLRCIQGTWKVKLAPYANRGYTAQMMLIWDYDRIWGSFDFGSYKGILMVDHGPRCEPPQLAGGEEENSGDGGDEDKGGEKSGLHGEDVSGGDSEELMYFDFTWRGERSRMPEVLVNNPLITKGKIQFGSTWIKGYFEGMAGLGRLPNSRCDFDGSPLFGPRRVPRDLESFIDSWNELTIFDEMETVRQAPAT